MVAGYNIGDHTKIGCGKRNVRVNMRMISDMQLIGGYAYVVATTYKNRVGN